MGLGQPGILGGNARGDAAGESRVRAARRCRDHQAAGAEAEVEGLENVGAGFAQDVGAGDAEIRGAGLDVDGNVSGLDHQKLDPGIAGRDEEPAARVRRRLGSGPLESLDRGLVESAFRQRDPEAAHAGTSAIVSRSRETPTAAIGRPNRPINSS